MEPGCQVAAICTSIKNQHWANQVQGMSNNFNKLHPWMKSWHQAWTIAAKWQQFTQPSKISIGSTMFKA